MQQLYNRILYHSGELDRLMLLCFGTTAEELEKTERTAGILGREEMDILCEFLSVIGTADTESECSRILLYKSLFEQRRDVLFEISNKNCRLWQTAGICAGLAICIFLM